MNDKTRHILFISLSNIGDAIMTTPVLQSLHQVYPNARVDIVAGKRSLPLFQYCPFRGELYLKDKQGPLRGYLHLWRDLIRHRYDLIVDLRFDGFTYLLRAGKRLTKWQAEEQRVHSIEQHMSVIRSIYQCSTIPDTCIWLSEEQQGFAKQAVKALPAGKWLAVGPGCGGPEKVWEAANYSQLCNRCEDIFSGIVLLGGEGDVLYADAVAASLNLPVVNLAGKTDVLQAAAVLEKCAYFIGSDSGLGHLASAVDTPSLTLFGVGHPHRYHPWHRQAAWLQGADDNVNLITVDRAYDLLLTKLPSA